MSRKEIDRKTFTESLPATTCQPEKDLCKDVNINNFHSRLLSLLICTTLLPDGNRRNDRSGTTSLCLALTNAFRASVSKQLSIHPSTPCRISKSPSTTRCARAENANRPHSLQGPFIINIKSTPYPLPTCHSVSAYSLH